MFTFPLHGEMKMKEDKKLRLTADKCKARFTEAYTCQTVEEQIYDYKKEKTGKAIKVFQFAIFYFPTMRFSTSMSPEPFRSLSKWFTFPESVMSPTP
ncbi:hypothetical protein SAMN05216383_10655 [Prevotella sp. KH2C16]|nr:hypothetical protein SAMN05216383_10655 [Prevotella sp. KH2C16]